MQKNLTPYRTFPILQKVQNSRLVIFEPMRREKQSYDLWVKDLADVTLASRRAVVLDADFVASLVIESEGKVVQWSDFAGMPCRPPFRSTWVEFDMGAERIGFMVQVDNSSGECLIWPFFKYKGEAIPAGYMTRAQFNADGTLASGDDSPVTAGYFKKQSEANRLIDEMKLTGLIRKGLKILFATFLFSHCKNVEMVERLPSRQLSRTFVRNKQKPPKYYQLIIDPNRKVYSSEKNEKSDHPKRSLHLARGHFAHYTEDKPLFGKYTGTFWRPAHVRGSADAGTVYKDYKVKP